MMARARRSLLPGDRIRVLVVDDSVVIRQLVTHLLGREPEFEVAGAAANGAIALERIPQVNPDVVTLDVEMPEVDGLEALRRIRRHYPALRVVMFSTLTERGGEATLEALSLGADDYVTKPARAGSLDVSMDRLSQELVPKLRQFFDFRPVAPRPSPPGPALRPFGVRNTTQPLAVTIGVSTGGPTALQAIVPNLPADLPVPVLIVQHMPPLFTRLLAERLDSHSSLKVKEAEHGAAVQAGFVYIAPGDYHMRVAKPDGTVRIVLDQGPPENSCRPAVDVLFRSAADVYAGGTVACLLTGMGQDGLRGAQALKAAGAQLLAQDEASSVIWGMPGAVVNAGLADLVAPLESMAQEIVRRSGGT